MYAANMPHLGIDWIHERLESFSLRRTMP